MASQTCSQLLSSTSSHLASSTFISPQSLSMHSTPLTLATLALAATSSFAAPFFDHERESDAASAAASLSAVPTANHTRGHFTLPWFHPSRTASLAGVSAQASSASHHHWPFHSSVIGSITSNVGPGIVTATSLASAAVPTHTGPGRHGQGHAYGHEHGHGYDDNDGEGNAFGRHDNDKRDWHDDLSSALAQAHSSLLSRFSAFEATATAAPISAFPSFTGTPSHHRNHTRTHSHSPSRTNTFTAEATETNRNGHATHKGKHRPFRHEFDDEENDEENEDIEDTNGDEASDDDDDDN